MDPPIILVSDFSEDPPTTTKYINGANELDFQAVYCNVNQLCDHPGRGRYEASGEADGELNLGIAECDPLFFEIFWKCASNICDYFADFFPFDTAIMQTVWFHMLDKLHEATVLPHQFWIAEVPFCSHAQKFVEDFELLQKIMSAVVGLRYPLLSEPLCRPNILLGAERDVELGGAKNGLKSWQNFLCQGSPGFVVPETERVYPHNAQGSVKFKAHIPQGGIALIDRYIQNTRAIAEASLKKNEGDPAIIASAMAEFDARIPDCKYPSIRIALNGRKISFQPMYPKPGSAEAPRRLSILLDPSFASSKPSLPMISECVGVHKGTDYFSAADDGKFHMMSFDFAETSTSRPLRTNVDPSAYADMYDDWILPSGGSVGG